MAPEMAPCPDCLSGRERFELETLWSIVAAAFPEARTLEDVERLTDELSPSALRRALVRGRARRGFPAGSARFPQLSFWPVGGAS